MMEEGFEQEVRQLRNDARHDPDLPAMRSVGYRQALEWLSGEYDRDEMRQKAIAATRQLAKRQLTWLRREEGCLWYDLEDENALGGLVSAVQVFLEA